MAKISMKSIVTPSSGGVGSCTIKELANAMDSILNHEKSQEEVEGYYAQFGYTQYDLRAAWNTASLMGGIITAHRQEELVQWALGELKKYGIA